MRRLAHTFSLLAAAALTVGLTTALPGPSRADESEAGHGRMMLVLDSSGSMAEKTAGGTTKIKAAKTALTRVVKDLPAESSVGLRVYGATVFSKKDKGACTDSQLAVPLGTDNRAELTEAIAGFKPYGETPIAHALREAAKDVGGAGKRSIVLVSDGIATCTPDPCEVAADLSSSGIDLAIDVVGLGVSGKARQQLQCIADRGNGTYYNVDSADEIASTLTRVSQRAVRPFTLTGTPVEGTRTPESAPIIAQGQWTDFIGGEGTPDAALHYRVQRRIPHSTLHVTVTTRGTPDKWDSVAATLADPQGTECSTEDDERNIDQYSVLSPQVSAGRDARFPEEGCWKADQLDLKIERGNEADTKRAPMAITVFEEPPARAVDGLPEYWDPTEFVAPKVTGPAQDLMAGSGFGDAPQVTSGVYALDIVPGESQIVKVPLDWGQQFTVRAAFPSGTPGVEELTGVQGPFGDLKMYSPLGGALAGSYVGVDDNAIMPGADDGELTAMSPVVRYRNREASGDTAYLPGDYFVVVSMNADHDGDTWVQPYELAIEVRGEPSGEPSYEGGATVTQPLEEAAAAGEGADSEPDPERAPATESTEKASQSEEDRTGTLPLVAASGAGLVGLAAVGGLVLKRRRRS